MQAWILFAIGIGAIVVIGALMIALVLLRNARTAHGPVVQGKYPQGHWMSIGMCIGIALGSIASLAGVFSDDMSSWAAVTPAVGLGIGVAIGAALEHNHKDESRPLTEEERRLRFRMTVIGLGALALLVLSLFVLGTFAFSSSR